MSTQKSTSTIRQLEKELASLELQLQESNYKAWGPRADQKQGSEYSSREFLNSVAIVEEARYKRDELRAEIIKRASGLPIQHRTPNPASITPVRAGLATRCHDLTPLAMKVAEYEALISAFEADPEWCKKRDQVVELWERRCSLTNQIAEKQHQARMLAKEAKEAEESFIADAVASAKKKLPERVQGIFSRIKQITGDDAV